MDVHALPKLGAPSLAANMLETIGRTPLVRLARYAQAAGIEAELLAKLEYYSPGGSMKDRIALMMIEEAERRGDLRPGMTVVEQSSGNTGTGVAMVCAAKGYKCIIVMMEATSVERRRMIQAFGAELVLSPCVNGPNGEYTQEDVERALAKGEEIGRRPGHWYANQFTNQGNILAHERTTAQEILEQTGGQLDAFVMAVGTAGVLVGVGRALKEYDPRFRIFGIEPSKSAVLSGGPPGLHKLQGMGAGFVPPLWDADVCDEIIAVDEDDAIATARQLARIEGLFGGFTGGANLAGARVAAERLGSGARIVTLIPDSGMKYFSTDLYSIYS